MEQCCLCASIACTVAGVEPFLGTLFRKQCGLVFAANATCLVFCDSCCAALWKRGVGRAEKRNSLQPPAAGGMQASCTVPFTAHAIVVVLQLMSSRGGRWLMCAMYNPLHVPAAQHSYVCDVDRLCVCV